MESFRLRGSRTVSLFNFEQPQSSFPLLFGKLVFEHLSVSLEKTKVNNRISKKTFQNRGRNFPITVFSKKNMNNEVC